MHTLHLADEQRDYLLTVMERQVHNLTAVLQGSATGEFARQVIADLLLATQFVAALRSQL